MSTVPPETIAQLSPIAAKLYLILHALADHSQPVPIARARAIDLAHATQSSTRWCWDALRELQTRRLIQPISRSNRRANAYLLLPTHIRTLLHITTQTRLM